MGEWRWVEGLWDGCQARHRGTGLARFPPLEGSVLCMGRWRSGVIAPACELGMGVENLERDDLGLCAAQ